MRTLYKNKKLFVAVCFAFVFGQLFFARNSTE
jgi:hypothetical protein